MRPWLLVALLLPGVSCRIETAAPAQAQAVEATAKPSGEVWVYTSMYRHVIDALEPVVKEALPGVTVHWYQAGSEKVATRLEAELAAGGTQCDLLLTSDPFLYERFKKEGRWLRYVSPNSVRVPPSLADPDGNYAAVRISTMVLARRAGADGPDSFAALTDPRFKGELVVGDPLTSGTAFTWAVFMEQRDADYFTKLRANDVRVGGGNAAVLQKLEGSEAKTGVLLLENALTARAKGSKIEIVWPTDRAVLVPGYGGILASTRNATATKALLDVLHSPPAQELIARLGDMHAADPRVAGPQGVMGLTELVAAGQPWSEALLGRGLEDGARVKAAFSKAFSR